MLRQNIFRYRFRYRCNNRIFHVFFFADEAPFILLFGLVGSNFAFEFKVERGFRVLDTFLDDDEYSALCEILGLTYDPFNPFSPTAFLRDFNNRGIPRNADISNIPRSSEIASYKEVKEEPHKVYFLGWKDNNLRNENVQPENLEKTRILLGQRYRDRCEQKNTSSCWTDNPDREEKNIQKIQSIL